MITALSICGCVLAMTASVICAYGKMKPLYVLGIINGCIFTTLNALIALAGEGGVALMMIPSAWMIVTNALGLRRLKRESLLRKERHANPSSPVRESEEAD